MKKDKIQKQFFNKILGCSPTAKANADFDHVYLTTEYHWAAKIPKDEIWIDLKKLEEQDRYAEGLIPLFTMHPDGELMGTLENEYKIIGGTLARKLTFYGWSQGERRDPVWVDEKVLGLFDHPMVFSSGGLTRVAIAEAGNPEDKEINIQAIVMPLRVHAEDDDLLG